MFHLLYSYKYAPYTVETNNSMALINYCLVSVIEISRVWWEAFLFQYVIKITTSDIIFFCHLFICLSSNFLAEHSYWENNLLF